MYHEISQNQGIGITRNVCMMYIFIWIWNTWDVGLLGFRFASYVLGTTKNGFHWNRIDFTSRLHSINTTHPIVRFIQIFSIRFGLIFVYSWICFVTYTWCVLRVLCEGILLLGFIYENKNLANKMRVDSTSHKWNELSILLAHSPDLFKLVQRRRFKQNGKYNEKRQTNYTLRKLFEAKLRLLLLLLFKIRMSERWKK